MAENPRFDPSLENRIDEDDQVASLQAERDATNNVAFDFHSPQKLIQLY